MKNTIRYFLIGKTFLIISLLFFSIACSSSGSDNTDPGSANVTPATVDLTGSWDMSDTIQSATSVCSGEVGTSNTYTLQADQDGNDLTVVVSSLNRTFTGTVSGNTINWSGSYPEDGGTTTVNSTNITATDVELSGTADWTWTDGFDTCSGTSFVQGYKF